jgi:creatinine amidohydrolase
MPDDRSVFLADLTWIEAREALAARPVGLLPIGAIEAHGPHLPLDTDMIIAGAHALRAAQQLGKLGLPALVLPPIAYTVSFAGTSFPGTSPVDAQAFEEYLTAVLTHVAGQGYRALVCCNAHLEPAHVQAVQQACARAEARTSLPVRAPDQRSEVFAALLSDEFRAGARHAGSYETSIVMAVKPDAVRESELRRLDPLWIDLPAQLRAGARTFAEAGSALGYFGDPKQATAEEGERMLDALAEMVITALRDAAVVVSS